jgi:hypothetical protein
MSLFIVNYSTHAQVKDVLPSSQINCRGFSLETNLHNEKHLSTCVSRPNLTKTQ